VSTSLPRMFGVGRALEVLSVKFMLMHPPGKTDVMLWRDRKSRHMLSSDDDNILSDGCGFEVVV